MLKSHLASCGGQESLTKTALGNVKLPLVKQQFHATIHQPFEKRFEL